LSDSELRAGQQVGGKSVDSEKKRTGSIEGQENGLAWPNQFEKFVKMTENFDQQMFFVFRASNVQVDELIHVHQNVIEFCRVLRVLERCDCKWERGSEPLSESCDSHVDESMCRRGRTKIMRREAIK
jgi:hypothetical protein